MIRSIRRKFILIAMLSLVGTMTALCATIGVGGFLSAENRVDRAITLLYQNGGTFLPPDVEFDPSNFNFQVTPETPFETRYFIVELTDRQEIESVDLEHIAALDRRTVVDTISRVLDAGTERGYVDYYRFGVFHSGDGGSTVIVMDSFLQLQGAYSILRISISVAVVCTLIVFILILFFSKRAIRPFVENLERQRQFVTDASHELKTPLAILSADLGLIEDSCRGNQWLKSAKMQIFRLDKLIKDLVELARTEETVKGDTVTEFSVSEIACACVDAFCPLAEAEGKTLTAEIEGGIYIRGVQDNLFRLCSILLDNAVKYCDPDGNIRMTLTRKGRNAYISVSDPCANLDPAQLPRYFDRFYRADSSRTRATGGYGIGLSTAKAIVTRHRGRISSHYADGVITFTAVIPFLAVS